MLAADIGAAWLQLCLGARLIEGKGRRTPISVIVAEHDVRLREEELLPALAACGFRVIGVGSVAALYRSLVDDHHDLVVLDTNLPDENGLAVARYLRRHSSLGIAMLMDMQPGHRHADALRAGVDICFTKPAERLGESMTRRRWDSGWSLEADGWQLAAPGGRTLVLSMPERIILKRLFATRHAPVPRAALLADLLASLHDFDPASLARVVHRLRRRVSQRTGLTLPLEVIRGIGYVLVIDDTN